MEAVRSALLTQTAQAAAGKSATNTPKPAAATPTPGGQAGGTPAATSVALPTAINVPATAKPACPYKYIVKSGDRLFRIGLNLGYAADFWEQIASANGIVSPWLIYPGQELTIPCPN
jgi:nucleoid-associated protein YgaU